MMSELDFFFQAEDGIRDIGVTGVQTCALPICDPVPVHLGHAVGAPGVERRRLALRGLDDLAEHLARARLVHPDLGIDGARSEERRVGKECRSRWSPYH